MSENQSNPFENSELTTILVVSDMAKSKTFYVDVLGADIFREYGGDSLVLKFLGDWILLVTPGSPQQINPILILFPQQIKIQLVTHLQSESKIARSPMKY